jgi:hypothetical protein
MNKESLSGSGYGSGTIKGRAVNMNSIIFMAKDGGTKQKKGKETEKHFL